MSNTPKGFGGAEGNEMPKKKEKAVKKPRSFEPGSTQKPGSKHRERSVPRQSGVDQTNRSSSNPPLAIYDVRYSNTPSLEQIFAQIPEIEQVTGDYAYLNELVPLFTLSFLLESNIGECIGEMSNEVDSSKLDRNTKITLLKELRGLIQICGVFSKDIKKLSFDDLSTTFLYGGNDTYIDGSEIELTKDDKLKLIRNANTAREFNYYISIIISKLIILNQEIQSQKTKDLLYQFGIDANEELKEEDILLVAAIIIIKGIRPYLHEAEKLRKGIEKGIHIYITSPYSGEEQIGVENAKQYYNGIWLIFKEEYFKILNRLAQISGFETISSDTSISADWLTVDGDIPPFFSTFLSQKNI